MKRGDGWAGGDGGAGGDGEHGGPGGVGAGGDWDTGGSTGKIKSSMLVKRGGTSSSSES